MQEAEARNALIATCRMLYDRKLTVSAGGNMSVRLDDGSVLITPSGRNKGLIGPGDLVKVDMDGNVLSGPKPSIETRFHLALYRLNPETNAVVHCHPLNCIALTIKGLPLRCNLTPEGILLLGKVPTIGYYTPGTKGLVDAVAAHYDSPVMLMERHGAIAQGRSLEEAYDRMEELEFQAGLTLMCEGCQDLPASEVARLGASRWRSSSPSGSASS